MRLLRAAFVIITGLAIFPLMATAQPSQRAQAPLSDQRCEKIANVDSCWQAGVASEKRGDTAAALAAYDASCSAGLQMGGCYEAGKIYFLNRTLRDYSASKDRMQQVCQSEDVGIGPYACKYLGIIYRKGIAGKPQPDAAFSALSRACFLHNPEPFIDGNACEILADDVPGAEEMDIDGKVWQPEYIAYVALSMGCSDDMPALCARALAIHQRAVARSAPWLALCEKHAVAAEFAGKCEDLPRLASTSNYAKRQELRRAIVRMFQRATDYSV